MSLIQRTTQLIQRGHAEASATLNTAAFRHQRGASAIEYVIIAAVIAFAIFIAANNTDLATLFGNFFDEVEDVINQATDD